MNIQAYLDADNDMSSVDAIASVGDIMTDDSTAHEPEAHALSGDTNKLEIKMSIPKWVDGRHGEGKALIDCYNRCLQISRLNGVKRIAMLTPPEACNYPLHVEVYAGIQTAELFMSDYPDAFDEIRFVCRNNKQLREYKSEITRFTEGYYDDIDVMSKKEEIISILSSHDVVIHTNSDDGFDWLEDGCVSIIIDNRMYINLDGQITLGLGSWHTHYDAYRRDYNYFLNNLKGILDNEKCSMDIFCKDEWLYSNLIDAADITEDGLRERAWKVLNQESRHKMVMNGYRIECCFIDPEKDIKIEVDSNIIPAKG